MGHKLWNLARLMAVLAVALSVVGSSSVYADDDNEKKNQNEVEHQRSQEEDRTVSGQVLEIDTLKSPPELILATVDGKMTVRVLKTDEIRINGIKTGQHITAVGEKINEQLFEAQELRAHDDDDDGDDEEDD